MKYKPSGDMKSDVLETSLYLELKEKMFALSTYVDNFELASVNEYFCHLYYNPS